jgi:hypothetical protein
VKDVLGSRGPINDSPIVSQERISFLKWRRHGPVDKLQGLVVFIRASIARRNAFITIQRDHLCQPP